MRRRYHKNFNLKKLSKSVGLPKDFLKNFIKVYEKHKFDLKEVKSTFIFLEFLNNQNKLNNVKIIQEFYKEHKFDYLFNLMKNRELLNEYKEYYGLKDVIVNNNKNKR